MNRYTQSMTPEQRAKERKAAIIWGAIIVAILGSSLTLAIVMIFVSGSDPSVAVEPDYYEQSINWDAVAAQRARNKELGWTIRFEDAPAVAIGQRTLTATLRDREGALIEGATLAVVAFHNARAADRVAFPMLPTGPGAFTAEQPLRKPGRWEFRCTVVTPDDTFTATKTETLDALPASGGPS